MLDNFGYDSDAIKSSKVKQIIKDKFCDNIGFHNRYIKNESTIVYDTSDGGSYIEAALYSWSISDEQLLHTCARRLREKFNSADYVDWPPTLEEVASAEEPEALLQKFLVVKRSRRKTKWKL